jgi:hypothetical protein
LRKTNEKVKEMEAKHNEVEHQTKAQFDAVQKQLNEVLERLAKLGLLDQVQQNTGKRNLKIIFCLLNLK